MRLFVCLCAGYRHVYLEGMEEASIFVHVAVNDITGKVGNTAKPNWKHEIMCYLDIDASPICEKLNHYCFLCNEIECQSKIFL